MKHANPALVEAALDKLVAEGRDDDIHTLADEVLTFPGDGPPPEGGIQHFSEKHGYTLIWREKPNFGRLEYEKLGSRNHHGFFREERGELAVLLRVWDPVTDERGHFYYVLAYDKRDIEGEAVWTDNEKLVVEDDNSPMAYTAFQITENEGDDPTENDCIIPCYGDAD